MKEWFQSLSGLEIAYFVIACVGTLFLLVQIILMIIGAADGDADFDTDTDGDGALDSHTDTGISLFTMKGLTAFFAIGGSDGAPAPVVRRKRRRQRGHIRRGGSGGIFHRMGADPSDPPSAGRRDRQFRQRRRKNRHGIREHSAQTRGKGKDHAHAAGQVYRSGCRNRRGRTHLRRRNGRNSFVERRLFRRPQKGRIGK